MHHKCSGRRLPSWPSGSPAEGRRPLTWPSEARSPRRQSGSASRPAARAAKPRESPRKRRWQPPQSRPIRARRPAAPEHLSATPRRYPPWNSLARVYAKTRFVWVRPEPDTSRGWMDTSGSAARPAQDRQEALGAGCTTWYEIEPRGFVCVDGRDATLDPTIRYWTSWPYAPKLHALAPPLRESRGVNRYRNLPSADEQRRREWDLAPHLARVARREPATSTNCLGVDLTPAKDRRSISVRCRQPCPRTARV